MSSVVCEIMWFLGLVRAGRSIIQTHETLSDL